MPLRPRQRRPHGESNDAVRLITNSVPEVDEEQAENLYQAAKKGGELEDFNSVRGWFTDRASFGLVILDKRDYITALIHALRIAPGLAATDFGMSRQRDLGQLWTDTARGFLGELGLRRFLMKRFNLDMTLDYTLGPLEDYLPSDVGGFRDANGNIIKSTVNASFKTTKFNGVWLDIPGAQIEHSDAFILVKLGIYREHFVAFLKWISFIKDKLIPAAEDIGVLDAEQAQELWDDLPTFRKIPCYISGFIDREMIDSPPPPRYREMHTRDGTLKGYMLLNYVGWVRDRRPVNVPQELPTQNWRFQSIGTFSTAPHFVANTGSLKYSAKEWRRILAKLAGDIA